jgi:hypothetical protein
MTTNTEAPGKRRTEEPDASEAPAPTMTAAGFRCRPGARLIQSRRPAIWLENALAAAVAGTEPAKGMADGA